MNLVKASSNRVVTKAIPFCLKGTDGSMWDLARVKKSNGLLVMFLSNHCPYVKSIIEQLVHDCKWLLAREIGCVAIMPNDVESYPEDSFENMQIFSEQHKFNFPYLLDLTQKTARDYTAICTPDFFGYNSNLQLQYHGRFDDNDVDTPHSNSTHELLNAMLEIAKSDNYTKAQHPSSGSSIKWRSL